MSGFLAERDNRVDAFQPSTPRDRVMILSGNKTFLAAALMIAYAIGGMGLGYVEPNDAVPMVLEGLAIIALRLGIKKAEL